MSSNRKMLKILSLVQIVFAVLCFVMASLVFNGTPRVEGDADVLTCTRQFESKLSLRSFV